MYKVEDSPKTNWLKNLGNQNHIFKDVVTTFMGRDAISYLLSKLENKNLEKNVLLPAYVCKEVIIEFQKREFNIYYYEIDDSFNIKEDYIVELIKNTNSFLFYHVIYFGILTQKRIGLISKLKNLFNNIFILEDRAHFLSDDVTLTESDAFIFSFRKLLPIPEGGGLLIKSDYSKPKYSAKLKANVFPFLITLKRFILGHNDKFKRSKLESKEKTNTIMPMSKLSKNYLKRFNYEIEVSNRHNLFNNWLIYSEKFGIKPVFKEANILDIPQGFPIYVNNAQKIQNYLRKEGYYLKRHWKLDVSFKNIAPDSYNLSTMVITLPIYTGIPDKYLKEICSLIQFYDK
ncbi:MAG: hypothetical protein ACOCQ4_00145 [bacterium]